MRGSRCPCSRSVFFFFFFFFFFRPLGCRFPLRALPRPENTLPTELHTKGSINPSLSAPLRSSSCGNTPYGNRILVAGTLRGGLVVVEVRYQAFGILACFRVPFRAPPCVCASQNRSHAHVWPPFSDTFFHGLAHHLHLFGPHQAYTSAYRAATSLASGRNAPEIHWGAGRCNGIWSGRRPVNFIVFAVKMDFVVIPTLAQDFKISPVRS